MKSYIVKSIEKEEELFMVSVGDKNITFNILNLNGKESKFVELDSFVEAIAWILKSKSDMRFIFENLFRVKGYKLREGDYGILLAAFRFSSEIYNVIPIDEIYIENGSFLVQEGKKISFNSAGHLLMAAQAMKIIPISINDGIIDGCNLSKVSIEEVVILNKDEFLKGGWYEF